MIIIVLLGFYVATGGKAPLAQQPSRLLAVVDSGVQMETGADRNPPAVILAPTFTAEPARRLIVGQLGELNKAYARWSESDPFTSGTVALKLSIEPSGKIAKVEEVVSRLSEHRFVDVVVAEVKQWKLPLGGTKTAEISVPLIFVPAKAGPAQLAAEGKSREPGVARQDRPTTHTSLAREQVEPAAPGLPTVAKNETRLQHHSRGRPARASDTGITPGAKGSDNSLGNVAVKRKLAATSTIPEIETEIARTAALKHAPRFAADVIEKVGPGTRVTVLRKERDWIKVKVKTSGKVGYLRKEYLAGFNTIR